MIKLEEMGTILMHIALQYTHPDFESMYSDWSTVHDIGEKLVKMSDQPQLNENQQKWINRLTINYSWYGGTAQHALHATLQEPEMPDLPQNEFAQVLEVFSRWVQEQEAE
ncbi:hypothetical protein I6I79_08245 [Enterococcus casseliflavus]|uniref:hypothetical protein n=1 Tax=Enterococcus casseliflavus TaxID=37734 RepID=UPI00191982E4|nr:hypothetical protein [Enterococcus casseliflavus]QQU17879.1 hypothetical protein I6I79_08245 [Enterococcus casseliflavus]